MLEREYLRPQVKGSANRAKNQIYLSFSELTSVFVKKTKGIISCLQSYAFSVMCAKQKGFLFAHNERNQLESNREKKNLVKVSRSVRFG